MNKQEAIEKVKEHGEFYSNTFGGTVKMVPVGLIIDTISQIDEPRKFKVSQVAVEFYEKYKDCNFALDEWFSDFYSKEAIEDFPRMEELAEWLHGNDNETNRRRELALATLVTLGIDAVEIEQEKLYTVEIPDPNSIYKHRFLSRNGNGVCIDASNNIGWKQRRENRLTESEIKEDFEWAWQWAKEVE